MEICDHPPHSCLLYVFGGIESMRVPRFWIWLKRFRYRRGYGVHSPFAFGFITWVIYEKGVYYAYLPLERQYGGQGFFSGRRRKDLRLLFRVANYAMPQCIATWGGSEAEQAWLMAARRKAVCAEIDKVETSAEEAIGMLYVDLDKTGGDRVFEARLPLASPRSVYVVKGIHATPSRRAWWKRMQEHPLTGVTFDLYDFGIVFFDHNLYKQHYIVNY